MFSGRWFIVASALAASIALGVGLAFLSNYASSAGFGELSGFNSQAIAAELDEAESGESQPLEAGEFLDSAPSSDLQDAAGVGSLAPQRQVTSLASVLNHTARKRNIQDNRRRALERQEARKAGMSIGRILEIATHPVFLIFLAIPLFTRRRDA